MKHSRERVNVPAPRWGILGLAAVLVVSGCSASGGETGAEAAGNGSSPSAGTDSAPTQSVASSAAPRPTASTYKPATAEGPAENVPLPVMPEIASKESKEGLIAFGGYWFDLVNYGYETGDAAPVKEISTPECAICASFYEDLDEGYVNEDWIQGGRLSILSSGTAFVKTPKGRYQLLLSVIQDAGANRGPNGKIYGEGPGDEASTAQIMEATYESGRWIVNLVENM